MTSNNIQAEICLKTVQDVATMLAEAIQHGQHVTSTTETLPDGSKRLQVIVHKEALDVLARSS